MAVRTISMAENPAERDTLDKSCVTGAVLCGSCWPEESMEHLDGVLGESMVILEGNALLRAKIVGLRVPGSWQRPHGGVRSV